MAIYRLPPSPFVGGRQPLAPKDFNPAVGEIPAVVDDPPPRRLGVLESISIAWQPIDPIIQVQKFVPLEQGHVPNPRDYVSTFISWTWYWPLQPFLGDLRTWGRAYYPTRPKFIPPDEPEVEGQVSFTRHPEIYNSWISEQLNLQPRTFTPIIEAAPPPVDDPIPHTSRIPIIVSNWEEKLSLIQVKPFVPTTTESPTEIKTPYLRPQLYITITPHHPILPVKSLAFDFIPAVVNDPPFGQRIWLNTILSAWTPPPFDFVYPIFVPEEPAPVDDPPFGRRVLWFNTVLDAWIPPPPPPWNPVIHYTPPPSGDIIIWMWKRVF